MDGVNLLRIPADAIHVEQEECRDRPEGELGGMHCRYLKFDVSSCHMPFVLDFGESLYTLL